MHPLSDAYMAFAVCVCAYVTRGAFVAHRHSFAPPCCRTSQYRRTFVPLSVSLDTAFDGVGLARFKSSANVSLLALSAHSFSLLQFYHFLSSMGWLCGVVWG